MNIGILPKLSKDYVLQYVTQEQIFERFLGIPVVYDTLIRNPLRNDRNPTCSFKWGGNKLRFKDWSGHFWGDCFDAVGYVCNIDPNDRQGFGKILDIIAKEFGIHKYAGNAQPVVINRQQLITGKTDSEKVVFEIKKREWNKHDGEYWTKFYIYKPALDYFNVYACDSVWQDGVHVYEYNPNDPCYAYYFGKDENGILDYQLYFPFRKYARFLINHKRVLGLNKIKPAEILVVTKSYKDIISLNCIVRGKYSIEAISPPSESVVIPKEVIHSLWTQYDYIVSLMDFDFAGRNMAWKLRNQYNIPPLFFTNGTRGSRYNYGSKDFSAYVKDNGRDRALYLVDAAYNYIHKKFPKTNG